jgi:frataxin-like iron-binding protein CyaY
MIGVIDCEARGDRLKRQVPISSKAMINPNNTNAWGSENSKHFSSNQTNEWVAARGGGRTR